MKVLYFFLEFSGFLLQVLPIILLFFLSFQDNELRFSREKSTLGFSLAMVLLAAVFSLVTGCIVFRAASEYKKTLQAAGDAYMAAVLVLFLAVAFLLVRASAMKKILISVMLIHYAAVLFTLCNLLNQMLYGILPTIFSFDVIYELGDVLVNIFLLLVSLPPVYCFIKNDVRNGLAHMGGSSLRGGCIYTILVLSLYCGYVFLLHYYLLLYRLSGMIIVLSLLVLIVTDMLFYLMFFNELRIIDKNSELKSQLQFFDEKYRLIRSSIAETRRMRHDLRHHLNTIALYNQNGDYKGLSEYLASCNAAILKIEQEKYCGYPVLDNLFSYYINIAHYYDIPVKTELLPLPETMNLDVSSLSVLIGNLMENAIEACMCLYPETSRFINIWLKQNSVCLLIEIENSCTRTGQIQADFTDRPEFRSTKKSVLHGQGLKSIQAVAEKYGGSAEFKKADGKFTARVVLNILNHPAAEE